MLNLKHLFQGGLPPAVADHQLLLVAVGTVAYWLILGYYKGESRKVRNRILASRTINANWSVFQTHFILAEPPPTGNPLAYTYPVDQVCCAAFLPTRSLELLVGCEEGDQCWGGESKCSYTPCRRC
jgi:hypothetical protein